MITIHIIIGNIFSLISAVCIALSAIKNSKKDFMYWQVGDTMSGILANIALSAHAALVTSIVCLIRNFLSYTGRLTAKITAVLLLVGVVTGLYANNLGVIGWLPVTASAIYTVCIYLTKTDQQMRYALIFNMALWAVHNFYVMAYPSALMNTFLAFWSAYQAIRRRQPV